MAVLDKSAGLERENAELRRLLAELTAEGDEALAQQTATAEVLQVINSSPGDLAPVFDAILEKAMRLCEAAFGMLGTVDGDELRTAAARGLPQAFVEFRKNNPSVHGPGRARVLAGERVVHILDLRNEEFYRTGDPNRRAIIDLGGARTVLLVALEKDGAVLGHIGVYRQEVQPFSDKQIALLQNFAAQAVIAMENARLLTETREALEQQTATAEVLQVINASPGNLAPVFEAILEKAHNLCDATLGALFLCDGGNLRAAATHGYPDDIAEELRQGYPLVSNSGPAALLAGARLVHRPDISQLRDPIARVISQRGGVRTNLLVPLRRDGDFIGMISCNRREVRPYTDKEIALIENFAAQAVIAMENARLLTETREALEQQTATAEVLQVINSSPGDLAPVFDAMLETATRLCDTNIAGLAIRDGDVFRYVATRSLDPAWDNYVRNLSFTPGRETTTGRTLLERRIVHVADLTSDPEHTIPEIVTIGGLRTFLGVPLLREGEPIGVLSLARQHVGPFTERQIALISTFADQAVIAMENARLLGELRTRTEEVAAWNRELEDRVAAQLGELERVGKLKRFLAPQLAELIVARGDENILETHRRDIVVVFCDLRGFTAFAETAEPEEVLDLLREYHGALGPIVAASEGTLDHFSGDGIMVFFNDPVPVPDASERAVRMAIEMRAAMALLQARWRRQGREIGFGAGIARGYATLGQIGFAERVDYTAIGTVCNLAARLCAEAGDGQILISRRVAAAVENMARLEEIGDLALKGLMQAVAVYNVAAEP
jgi:class 3 adenylate cyclase/putative methionine-R-sulfoxide reductase with GAF domain